MLVTRIGRNGAGVLAVLKTLVHFGAPENILVDGKPHLGTDRLIPILRNFRHHLQGLDVGLRIEHPQELINNIQYSGWASEVRNGRGKVPVADYKVVKCVGSEDGNTPVHSGATSRSCYSFCMCPGGQVVLTSTNAAELCINGMSFSKRASKWGNAALVVTVSSSDFDALNCHGPLAGVEFQTRTSSPVQIPRNNETYESTSIQGLYPVGEGAGYAGGIVSAAADGMYAGFALAKKIGLCSGGIESVLGKAQNSGSVKY